MQFEQYNEPQTGETYDFVPNITVSDYFVTEEVEQEDTFAPVLKELTSIYGKPGESGRWMYNVIRLDGQRDERRNPQGSKILAVIRVMLPKFLLEVAFRDPNDAVQFKLTYC